jgi:transcriptional regulator with XRE-family HTH domain
MFMDGNTRAALARNVRKLRDRHDWTQTDLARRAGIAQTAISYVEREDGKSPTVETLVAIANALRLPAWVLLLPELPTDAELLARLERLTHTYLHIEPNGQRTLDAVADAEMRYASARKPSD